MGCIFIESFDRIRVQCYSKSTPILIAAESVITVTIHYQLLRCLLLLLLLLLSMSFSLVDEFSLADMKELHNYAGASN